MTNEELTDEQRLRQQIEAEVRQSILSEELAKPRVKPGRLVGAQEYVAYRVFVQTLTETDQGKHVRTWYEVVDRFEVGNKIVGEYDDEAAADAACAAIRATRTAAVERNPLTFGGVLR